MSSVSVADERSIQALLTNYATAIDTRDWLLFRACFTDDACCEYGEFGHWDSGEAITTAMEVMHKNLGISLHRLTNIVIKPQGDSVSVRSYVDAILCAKEAGQARNRGVGYYDDRVVLTRDGWKIAERTFTLAFQETINV